MLIVAGIITCLVLVGTYSALVSFDIYDGLIKQTPKEPQVQILGSVRHWFMLLVVV
jgi:hypothetical protein